MSLKNLLRPRFSSEKYRSVLALIFFNLMLYLTLGFFSYQMIISTEKTNYQVQSLQKNIFELNTLAQDYLTAHSSRALRQWHNKYAITHSLIVNLNSIPPEQIYLLGRIGRDLSELQQLMTDYKKVNSDHSSLARREQLASHIRYLAHDTSAKILELSQHTQHIFDSRIFWTWFTFLVIILGTKASVAFLAFRMWRQNTENMVHFKKGIMALSEGRRPDWQIPTDDELNIILSDLGTLAENILKKQESTLAELKKQKEIAQSASRAKSTFLANISHEIRTPLSVIDGYTNLIIAEGAENRMDYLSKIHWNVKYIVSLVNELLDLSKIEAQKMEIHSEWFELKDLGLLFDLMKQKASKSNLSFEVFCSDPMPLKIKSDLKRIEQILMNLISNAIKYTQTGGLKIRISFFRRRLHFEIEDTGIGLTSEQAENIFSPFYQANPNQGEGTGLGLALSVKLAELIGGKVFLKKTSLGHGSIFAFELPILEVDFTEMDSPISFIEKLMGRTPEPLTLVRPPYKNKYSGLKILIAEDNQDLRLTTGAILRNAGAEVVFACDGKEAVAIATDSSRRFDLILLDIQMPIMDGYAACKEIRRVNTEIPILAFSARLFREEVEQGLAVGMNGYLEKPLNIDKFSRMWTGLRKKNA